ncbi:hypothetical protein Golob_017618 [Gossypium lobatum]|uniref:Uncharacterized protein n=1 Tax=Gossypium lobatum TaxID=34289 RepID=A0A7J8M7Z0_9ROSI|nr:hypothetical protein [Gossypium lobatum]
MVIFPKALRHIDDTVSDLFNLLDKRVTPVLTIVVETFRSLSVPLLGIWGAIGYAPQLVLRQYRLRQFILATQGFAQCKFAYKGDNYKKKVREILNAWNKTHKMQRFFANPMMTPDTISDGVKESTIMSLHQVKKLLGR